MLSFSRTFQSVPAVEPGRRRWAGHNISYQGLGWANRAGQVCPNGTVCSLAAAAAGGAELSQPGGPCLAM